MDIVSRFLFPAPPPSYTASSFLGELLCVPKSLNPQTCAPEDFVPLLLLRYPSARFLILFLHSNFEDIGRCYPFCKALCAELGVHVLAVEYPGYGICPGGRCDERHAIEVTSVAFRFVCNVLRWPVEHIIVLGRSIGTGPAVSIAFTHAVGGLVLVSPFLSVREICRDTLGPVIASFIEERFPNKERMPFIHGSVLVVHGEKDDTIPPRHGRRLYALCRARRRIVSPTDLDHNSNLLATRHHFIEPMMEFFDLPQLCYSEEQDLQVPIWAFEWRCPPKPLVLARTKSETTTNCVVCSLALCSQYQFCACGRCGEPYAKPVQNSRLVEETIAVAVENVLVGGCDEDSWVESNEPDSNFFHKFPNDVVLDWHRPNPYSHTGVRLNMVPTRV